MPLKVCLIGVGHMGKIHARKLAGMRDVHLTSIVDINNAAGDEIAGQHGACYYDECGKAISGGFHAAVVASNTDSHYAIAEELLQNNIHVFIEKPIAGEPAQARKLIDLARKKGLVLQIGHLERFSPPFRKAIPAIKAPFFIEARRTSVFTGRSVDIDVIHDVMIHDIDLVLSIVKDRVKKLEAWGTAVLTGMIDCAYARIEFAGGCTAILSASRISSVKERTFNVIQKDASFFLDLGGAKMSKSELGTGGQRKTSFWSASVSDPVNDELKAFINSIRRKERAVVDGEDGLQALLLADAITAEIEQSKPVNQIHVV